MPGPMSKAFPEELWNTPVPSGEQRSFDGLLYLMSMMPCNGNCQIKRDRRYVSSLRAQTVSDVSRHRVTDCGSAKIAAARTADACRSWLSRLARSC